MCLPSPVVGREQGRRRPRWVSPCCPSWGETALYILYPQAGLRGAWWGEARELDTLLGCVVEGPCSLSGWPFSDWCVQSRDQFSSPSVPEVLRVLPWKPRPNTWFLLPGAYPRPLTCDPPQGWTPLPISPPCLTLGLPCVDHSLALCFLVGINLGGAPADWGCGEWDWAQHPHPVACPWLRSSPVTITRAPGKWVAKPVHSGEEKGTFKLAKMKSFLNVCVCIYIYIIYIYTHNQLAHLFYWWAFTDIQKLFAVLKFLLKKKKNGYIKE